MTASFTKHLHLTNSNSVEDWPLSNARAIKASKVVFEQITGGRVDNYILNVAMAGLGFTELSDPDPGFDPTLLEKVIVYRSGNSKVDSTESSTIKSVLNPNDEAEAKAILTSIKDLVEGFVPLSCLKGDDYIHPLDGLKSGELSDDKYFDDVAVDESEKKEPLEMNKTYLGFRGFDEQGRLMIIDTAMTWKANTPIFMHKSAPNKLIDVDDTFPEFESISQMVKVEVSKFMNSVDISIHKKKALSKLAKSYRLNSQIPLLSVIYPLTRVLVFTNKESTKKWGKVYDDYMELYLSCLSKEVNNFGDLYDDQISTTYGIIHDNIHNTIIDGSRLLSTVINPDEVYYYNWSSVMNALSQYYSSSPGKLKMFHDSPFVNPLPSFSRHEGDVFPSLPGATTLGSDFGTNDKAETNSSYGRYPVKPKKPFIKFQRGICRYDVNCERVDCRYSHPQRDRDTQEVKPSALITFHTTTPPRHTHKSRLEYLTEQIIANSLTTNKNKSRYYTNVLNGPVSGLKWLTNCGKDRVSHIFSAQPLRGG